MATSNVCWGIELGAGGIKAVKLQRDGDDVRVLDYAVLPHKKVLSTPELDMNDAIRVALGQLVSQKDLTNAAIAISIPGHSSFARFAKLPPVEPKKIPDIVKFEAVQQIPFPIDQVEWDYQTFTSKDNPDVEVGIFAVTRDKITERLQTYNEVGVTPEFVTLGPLAAYNAIAWDQDFNDKTPGTVILDVGTTSTDLIVSEPGRAWIRTFPIGGHQFTEALVGAFKLSYVKAEALKRQAEQSTHARHILQAMRPVFSDLAQDVQRSIGYYQSSHKDANLTRLIGLGSTFNLPGLRKYLGQQLQMEIVRLEKFNKLTIEGPTGAEFEAATINLATAYGLALQGLGFKFGIMANLVPIPIVREGVWKKKTKWFAAAAGLSVAAGAVSFYRPVVDRASNPASNKPASIQQTSAKIGQLKSEWTEVQKQFVADFKATNVAMLPQHRDVHAKLLSDVGVMLKSAGEKASVDVKAGETPELLSFRGLGMNYVGPGGESGGSSSGRGGSSDGQPTVNLSSPVGGRVSVTMELQTLRADAETFLVQSVMKWLSENADRTGMPYAFDVKSLRYEITGTETFKADKAPGAGQDAGGGATDDGGVAQPDGGGGGGEPAPPPSSGGKFGGGGIGGGGIGGGRGRGGGGDDDRPPPTDGDPAMGGGTLDQVAPIPAPPPLGKPGQTLTKIKVWFDAVIRDPNAKTDDAKKEGKS
jgi:type IV pilus assembly protein PilM